MNNLITLFTIIVLAGIFVALIIFIVRLFFGGTKTFRKKRRLHIDKGWYFINKKQTPGWIKRKWHDRGIDWSYGTVTEECEYAKGSYYEYKLVVVDSGHTHDCAVIRRRLKWRKRHH